MTNVYSKRLDYLKERGLTQKIHCLDNETVKGIQYYDKQNDINFQNTLAVYTHNFQCICGID